jgi:hypothetical protein
LGCVRRDVTGIHSTASRKARGRAVLVPRKFPPSDPDVWNVDHAGAQLGLLNDGFVRASVTALRRLIEHTQPDTPNSSRARPGGVILQILDVFSRTLHTP